MIGDDDWATFFDPDEFGVEVVLHAPGVPPSPPFGGMWSRPPGRETVRRPGPKGTGLRVAPDERRLQIPSRDLPDDWRETRVEVDGVSYAIGDLADLGRLRVELILTPWQERSESHGSWLRP